MRFAFLLVFCLLSAGCVKTDLEPFPNVTRVDINNSGYVPSKDLAEIANVSAIVKFIDGERLGWTRTFLGGPGAPAPFVRANLYSGNRYVGQFAVASGVLPGGHARFEAQCGKIHAYKVVSKPEANRFLDLIGIGADRSGELR